MKSIELNSFYLRLSDYKEAKISDFKPVGDFCKKFTFKQAKINILEGIMH